MLEKHENNFELCVRAVIQNNGKILVCKNKAQNYYFFPGGHINFSETAEVALERELKEELDISIKGFSFIGVVENVFKEQGETRHELNLIFSVEVKKVKDKSKEDHLDFFFFDIERLSRERVLPLALRNSLIKWTKDGNVFWASQV